MAVQDEIVILCSELHASGISPTYNVILKARGGGSRRDISAGLREWRRRRAQEAASASLKMPDHIAEMGDDLVKTLRSVIGDGLVHKLWSAMEAEFAELKQEVQTETNVIELLAGQEIGYLHQLLGDQHSEIERLKAEIEYLSSELERKS